jgi:hypothetical protein
MKYLEPGDHGYHSACCYASTERVLDRIQSDFSQRIWACNRCGTMYVHVLVDNRDAARRPRQSDEQPAK